MTCTMFPRKAQFSSHSAAKKEASRLMLKGMTFPFRFERCEAYRCPACGQYHVGRPGGEGQR